MTGRRRTRCGARGRRAVVALLTGLLLVVTAAPAAAADPARDRQWALDVIGAGSAQTVGQGAGTVIAVVDTGVDLGHEDLAANVVAGIDIVDGDDVPQDEHGHGTHVAGIAAAVGGNGRGIVGVAPRASIMPVRVLDADGSGTAADVSAGVRWAADNGADVINLSLTETGQSLVGSSLAAAIRDAWDQGAIVVVAAGNQFVLSSGFADEPAIVVSATTRRDGKPDYSNGVGRARWGMAAPGGGCALLTCPTADSIFSTWWDGREGDVYAYLAGTSMAAPHVAGAAAVLLSLGLDQQAVVDRLLATAEDLGPSGRDSTYGAGRLDLAAAVDGLVSRSDPGPSGAATPTASAGGQDPPATATTAPPAPATPAPSAAASTPSGAPAPTPPATPVPTPTPDAATAAPVATPSTGTVASATPHGAGPSRTPLLVAALVAVTAAGAGVAAARHGTRRR